MRSVDSWLDRFAFKHSKFGIPNLMLLIILGNVAVFLLDSFSGGSLSLALAFYPDLILRGEVWRIITFIFVPENSRMIWFVVSMFFYYFIGTTMEREWGTAKFTLFYACGILLSIIGGFVAWLFMRGLGIAIPTASMYYVNLSLFLAFATLYPDVQFRVYFILPIKAKWLAIFYVALMAWDLIQTPTYLMALVLPITLSSILASLGNYALFFWSDISRILRRSTARAKHQNSKQTINFKKAAKDVQKDKGYLHKCAVCGVTDADDPNMEFRYCSKCTGYYCYCMNHINNHVHIQ